MNSRLSIVKLFNFNSALVHYPIDFTCNITKFATIINFSMNWLDPAVKIQAIYTISA